jgi:hypothetical protein
MPEQRVPGHQEETFDREIGLRGIVWFAVGLAILIVVSGVAMWGLFTYLRAREAARPTRVSPVLLQEGVPAVPEPHLQTAPEEDLRAMRAAEDSLLHSFGWVERDQGIARVPVERGMEMLLHEGLPTRPEPLPWVQPGTWRDPSLQRVAREEDS